MHIEEHNDNKISTGTLGAHKKKESIMKSKIQLAY